MNRPRFVDGVVVALIAALIGSMALTIGPAIVGLDITLRLTIAGLGLGYMLYLLARSEESIGRVVTVVGWLLASGIAGSLIADPLIYLALHLVMLWLVRVLYHQPGFVAALLDLGLHLLATTAGIWAFVHADSVFLGIWSFFLVQALFTALPAAQPRKTHQRGERQIPGERFAQAQRSAEAALRRLSATH